MKLNLRAIASVVRHTPLHPQWLLGSNKAVRLWLNKFARGCTLDVGCADRWVFPHLPEGCEYIGLDYPTTGQKMYGARPDVFADASALPLADESVDTVIMLEVMEHLRHPTEALREIARALRPRGRLLLSIPFLYPFHDAPHDYQRLTLHGLQRDVETAGLQIEQLIPSVGSAESAGLIGSLALGGMTLNAIRERRAGALLAPLLLLAIPVVNLSAWLLGKLLPSWSAVTAGYLLIASKP